MDQDGYLFFKGRSKEIIIRGGANLYPAEIEAFLKTNPDILDVYVFGVSKSAKYSKLRANSGFNTEIFDDDNLRCQMKDWARRYAHG
jgi:acyl-CoA synthetase (AMP-forming)/AMP-acid ligase II